jgi:para-nitrobenzyl esterase
MHMPAAKDLFHTVICESGTPVNYRETNPAEIIKGQQAVAGETLKNLGLDGSEMDKVKKVPYGELLAAFIAAYKTLGKQLDTRAWDPVADDVYVLREFCDWADSIPFIAGNVMSEFNSNLGELEVSKNEWTQKQIEDRLTAAYGDKKDEVVAEFRKVYPGKKVQDVLFVDNGNLFRRGTKTLLARKLEKNKGSVAASVEGGQIEFGLGARSNPGRRGSGRRARADRGRVRTQRAWRGDDVVNRGCRTERHRNRCSASLLA